jgi:Family of unknown function (DUF6527)
MERPDGLEMEVSPDFMPISDRGSRATLLRRPRRRCWLPGLGSPPVVPSVWQTIECCSHFWIRKGPVEWSPGIGRPARDRPGWLSDVPEG